MHCLIGCLALAFPRLALVLVWLFSNLLGRAYDTWVWPLLGFFFLPLTTLAYAWAVDAGGGDVSGMRLVVVVVAALLDLGAIGGSGAAENRRRRSRRG